MQGTYLAHHGIKGQKWGVRRYQNRDGTLTNAGKKRASDMSDEELRTAINRKQLENRYVNLKSNSGGYKIANDSINMTSKAAKTAGSVANVVSKSGQLSGNTNLTTRANTVNSISNTSGKFVDSSKKIDVSKSIVKSKTDFSKMSDSELKKQVDRMALEQQYNELYRNSKSEKVKNGAIIALDVVGATAGLAATGLTIAVMAKKLKTGG